MKLRLVRQKGELKLLCTNGSTLDVDKKVLASLLVDFKHPGKFKGDTNYWSFACSNMEEVPGEMLAYVDDANRLIIYDENLFADIVESSIYISVTEYAELHGKSRPMIKKLCLDGRISGAQKHSTGWLIPKNAPYPKDNRLSDSKRKSKGKIIKADITK